MKYCQMKKIGVSPSLLGFGCMRLALRADGSIDEETSQAMVDTAIKGGVNYLDTAYPYHGGESERFVGRVLKRYDRSKLLIATKLPMWKLDSEDSVGRIFREQLEKLQTPYVDFYLMHGMSAERIDIMKKYHVLEQLKGFREEGKIRFLGFSFHDKYETFERLIDMGFADMCQIQFNYIDTDRQAGAKGLEYARKAGVPVVVMEPVKGGSLARLPDDAQKLFDDYSTRTGRAASASSWALRWAAAQPGVTIVLSGMSSPAQVQDNLKTFNDMPPMDAAEEQVVVQVTEKLRGRIKVPCTACKYCMPCPYGVNIPDNFAALNTWAMFGDKKKALDLYFKQLSDKERATACKNCKACVKLCPQKIAVPERLAEVDAAMQKLK
jgi:predicted aldo/keto reductase-like oxidoreductase